MAKLMCFKQLVAFRLAKDWVVPADRWEAALAQRPFNPCGSQEAESLGFVPPTGGEHAPLVHTFNGQHLIALQVQRRILPTAVLKEAVEERVQTIVENEGRKVGRKERKELMELCRAELLPKAFLKTTQIRAWVDTRHGWFAIEAGSGAKADTFIEALAKVMDILPITRVETLMSPSAAMTSWLVEGEAPAGFTIDQDCELRNAESAVVRYVRHTLEGKDVLEHIAKGKVLTRLALTFDDRVSFVLTDKQEIKKLTLLDILTTTLDEGIENPEDRFNAEFALMSGEFSKLLQALFDSLGMPQD